MDKYESALKQVCLQCKTSKNNCKKDKCNRHSSLKELVDRNKLTPQEKISTLLFDLNLNDLKVVRRMITNLINKKTLEERKEEE